MLKKQDYKCAIKSCTIIHSKTKKLTVDHNHITNKVRGLLCKGCNLGLRYVENAKFRKESLKYLKKFKGRGNNEAIKS